MLVPSDLRVSGTQRMWHDHGAGAKPRMEFRAPVMQVHPLPFEWLGESEEEWKPGRFAWRLDGQHTLTADVLKAVQQEYPLLTSISSDGPNRFAGDDIAKLAAEFERASEDDRFGRPWRLGLAARLMRRFAGRMAEVSLPGR
ncbi:MAG: hypothetical protein CVT64_11115 [Actinobacteria bacterium HGW-Actinobacteria-4]|nr:MAG: hypothetical protein CVT64_11115 [Actinobacteria bacterium HGW-Actinobacteria-4]